MFESIRKKSKEDFKTINEILNKLDKLVYNRELTSIFFKYLDSLLKEKNYYIDFCSTSEVCIKKKKSKDMFHILITPSLDKTNSIGIKIVDKDGTYEEEIMVQFKRDIKQVVVSRNVIEKKVQGKKQDVSSIINKTNIRNYIDSILRYEYEYTTETCFRLSQNYSCATLSETFSDLDKCAVRRVAHISEDAYYDDPAEVIYYESDRYEPFPFENRFCNGEEEVEMELSSESKFNEFVDANNNLVNLRKQK